MKSAFLLVSFFIAFFSATQVQAQSTTKVAVFAPLYIDSAFDGSNYKLGNSNLPRYILPGLEFYNGVMLAVDSLSQEGQPVEVLVYDTKSKEGMASIIKQSEMQDVSLIIAAFTSRNEIKPLADLALQKQIPLISATYPNDGGIQNNPYFAMLNSTLKTHCEQLYKYMQRNYAVATNIVYLKKKGVLEDLIYSYFSEMVHSTGAIPLKMKILPTTDSCGTKQLVGYLDSTKTNVVVCGSVNETFGAKLVRNLSSLSDYKCVTIGMPTWEAMKELDRDDCKGVEIVYSTPQVIVRSQPLAKLLAQRYYAKCNARPSDMVFKGYETMYHFTKLVLANANPVLNYLSDRRFKIFNDFDVEPVKNATEKSQTDYLENKKLYFIKKQDGVML